jgi:hypothetical protein
MESGGDEFRGLRRLYQWTGQQVNRLLDRGHSGSSQFLEFDQPSSDGLILQHGRNGFADHYVGSDRLRLWFGVSDIFSFGGANLVVEYPLSLLMYVIIVTSPCYCLHTAVLDHISHPPYRSQPVVLVLIQCICLYFWSC